MQQNLKLIIFLAHLMLFGREFHRAAVDVSISRLPYLTVLLRFGTSDVVDEDCNGLAGVYH